MSRDAEYVIFTGGLERCGVKFDDRATRTVTGSNALICPICVMTRAIKGRIDTRLLSFPSSQRPVPLSVVAWSETVIAQLEKCISSSFLEVPWL